MMKFLPHVHFTEVSPEDPVLQDDKANDYYTVVYTLLM